jgi:hypothetical protein
LLVIVLGAPCRPVVALAIELRITQRHAMQEAWSTKAGALSRHRASDHRRRFRALRPMCAPSRCWMCWRRQLAPPRRFAVARSHAARPPDLGLPRIP